MGGGGSQCVGPIGDAVDLVLLFLLLWSNPHHSTRFLTHRCRPAETRPTSQPAPSFMDQPPLTKTAIDAGDLFPCRAPKPPSLEAWGSGRKAPAPAPRPKPNPLPATPWASVSDSPTAFGRPTASIPSCKLSDDWYRSPQLA